MFVSYMLHTGAGVIRVNQRISGENSSATDKSLPIGVKSKNPQRLQGFRLRQFHVDL